MRVSLQEPIAVPIGVLRVSLQEPIAVPIAVVLGFIVISISCKNPRTKTNAIAFPLAISSFRYSMCGEV
ncbi:hypothetical protein [Paenibacillus endoradicis]|uniref:hypothetical protein n=1 Tax=Paenibacillus endoradicis TaxID=2972487 RepID=UPI00215909A6|nr:hypothetical protein [Paenibacillus endoradicis]MCR8659541.1 hypothetical protein [Paenibacillus endoradicis]